MRIFGFFLLTALAATLWTESLIETRQNLFNNPHWYVGKSILLIPPMGAFGSVFGRSQVRGRQLDLGSYYGHQEIYSRERRRLTKLSFRFRIGGEERLRAKPNDYFLDLEMNGDDIGFEGVRFCGMPPCRSFYFRSDRKGNFTMRHELAAPALAAGWHTAEIQAVAGSLRLLVDEQPFAELTGIDFRPGFFGFRSGLAGAFITQVRPSTVDGLLWEDNFRNETSRVRLWILCLDICLLLSFCAASLLSIGVDRNVFLRHWLEKNWLVMSRLCALAIVWFLFDHFYFSLLPINWHEKSNMIAIKNFDLESLRWNLSEKILDIAVTGGKAAPFNPFTPVKSDEAVLCSASCSWMSLNQAIYNGRPGAARVLFIGGSLSRGDGARALDETFYARIHAHLLAELGPSRPVDILNYAGSGFVKEMVPAFEKEISAWQPNVIVTTFRYNDKDEADPEQRRWMQRLFDWQKARKARIIFVKVPFSPEIPEKVSQNLEYAHSMANGTETLFLDPSGFFQQLDSEYRGFLWWDMDHMTSAGQEYFAEFLFPYLREAVTAARGKP